jgi:Tfp pilus assembly protein PilF
MGGRGLKGGRGVIGLRGQGWHPIALGLRNPLFATLKSPTMPPATPAPSRPARPSHGLRAACAAALWACLCGGTALAASPAPSQAGPFQPDNDAEVLQQVPPASDPAVRRMHQLRGQLDAAPGDMALAHRLADTYVAFGRQVGDAHYAGYAEAVIAPWLARPAPAAATLLIYANILQYRHQFDEARVALARALKADPRHDPAWLTLATLDMVQGRHADAATHCGMLARDGAVALGVACGAALRSSTGQAAQSLKLLALLEAQSAGLPEEFRAWIDGLQAEASERLGDAAGAEAHYRRALALTPEDNFLLVAFADLLLDQHRPQEVLRLLAGHEASDTAFLRIVLAQAALQSPELPRYVWAMGARFEALRQRGSEFFGREEVRFALELRHDPQDALALAQANWQQQREPWDARVFLQAALAAGQPQAAQPVLDFIALSHLQDPAIASLAARLRSAGAAS